MAICGKDKKSKKEEENKDPNEEGKEDEDEESSVQSHHPEDLSMFETPQERIEYLSRRRHSNPMPRMNRDSDDSESVYSYDSNGMPYKSEKKGKCCSKSCWGRTWRTDLCCLIPATAVVAAPVTMVLFCNGAFDCRNVPEGFTDDAENWSEEDWKKWFNLDNSGEIPEWLADGNGESTDQMIAKNIYGAAGDWLYDFLRDGDAEDVRTLYSQADHIFGDSFLSLEELEYTQMLLQNDTCGDQMHTLFTESIGELRTRFEYQGDVDGNGQISYDEAHRALDFMFLSTMEFTEGGGGELQDEYEAIQELYAGKQNGQSVLEFWKTMMAGDNPQFERIWNESLSFDGMMFKEMKKIVGFWDNEDSTRFMECVSNDTMDADVRTAIEYFYPQDGMNWNPFWEIIFNYEDNLAQAQARG